MALRLLLPFRQAQYVQVFLLKPAPFCMLFAGLGSTNKSTTSLLFSSYLILFLSSPPCPLLHLSFYLNPSGRSVFSLLLLYQATMGPRTLVSCANDEADELARRGALLVPLQSLVVSPSSYPLLYFFELEAYCLI